MHGWYRESMTRRLTITVPDDVAERLDREDNASAYITSQVRAGLRSEAASAMVESHGYVVTDEGRVRARAALRKAQERAESPDNVQRRAQVFAAVDVAIQTASG